MTDFPLPSLPTSNRAARDRIEAVLAAMPWFERQSLGIDGEHSRRVAAGVLRKAFMPELARMRDVEETLERVRRVARQYPEDEAIPVRLLLAALYGEDSADAIAREQAERWKAEQAAQAEAQHWGEASREMIADMSDRRERQFAERRAEVRRLYGGAEDE